MKHRLILAISAYSILFITTGCQTGKVPQASRSFEYTFWERIATGGNDPGLNRFVAEGWEIHSMVYTPDQSGKIILLLRRDTVTNRHFSLTPTSQPFAANNVTNESENVIWILPPSTNGYQTLPPARQGVNFEKERSLHLLDRTK